MAASEYAQASKAISTRRAYQSDAADFALWCKRQGVEALPASVETVVAYLAALAKSGLKASTITRRRAAIAYLHRLAGLESPTTSEAAKAVLAGIRRSLGTAVTRKAPITAKAIRAMLEEMPSDLRGLRDRSLLLIGFAGALRRSELVGLDVEDIEDGIEGIFLQIRRSKTDQEGQGDFVSIPNGYKFRPVAALRAWLDAAGITDGSIFRSIKKGGGLTQERLTDRSVAEIIKKRSAAAGLDAVTLSGHSLRSGFVTEALNNGADVFRVMDVTRHRQVNTLKIYDRRAKAFQDHAGAAFL
jgi:site-specific recombinase XerD